MFSTLFKELTCSTCLDYNWSFFYCQPSPCKNKNPWDLLASQGFDKSCMYRLYRVPWSPLNSSVPLILEGYTGVLMAWESNCHNCICLRVSQVKFVIVFYLVLCSIIYLLSINLCHIIQCCEKIVKPFVHKIFMHHRSHYPRWSYFRIRMLFLHLGWWL